MGEPCRGPKHIVRRETSGLMPFSCSLSGERMPQKSTDFYPKMITGLVMLPVGADGRL